MKAEKIPNVTCTHCGKEFYVKPCKLKLKHSYGIFCSRECLNKFRETAMRGEGNHQYGLKGDKNASFKGEITNKRNNKLMDEWVYCPEHPFANKSGRVKSFRLKIEEHYKRFDPKYFIEIDGKMYLRPEVAVHHKNLNHDDNSLSNLEPLTKAEHTVKHNLIKYIIRHILGVPLKVYTKGNVEIKVKVIKEGGKIPTKHSEYDAGFDLYAPNDIHIKEGRNVVPLGIAVEIPIGYAANVRARSGNTLKGMPGMSEEERHDADVILGLVDCKYRDELGVLIKSYEDFVIKRGMRIAQLQVIDAPLSIMKEVEELDNVGNRGGGYGHSGA